MNQQLETLVEMLQSNNPEDVYLGENLFRSFDSISKKWIQNKLIGSINWVIVSDRRNVLYHRFVPNNDKERKDIISIELRGRRKII